MNTTGSGTIIDMTPDGRFADRATGSGWPAGGITALAIAGGLVVLTLALAVWVAITLLPVLLGIGILLYLTARLRSWRRRIFQHRHPIPS